MIAAYFTNTIGTDVNVAQVTGMSCTLVILRTAMVTLVQVEMGSGRSAA